ncbi:hypothetical protein AK812_SmicGene28983 [Symbiodinium microadriaticum]|uniref:Uncharacterized protein n=1 Tax=Symbiodinium microadriaticum TaxID=2951 RepID=A0A1Q9D2X8_SYMMI|nr:hypothetical protein AK812_SmicGene28983 [Symbiodinium microadriaticum]
MRSLLTKGRYHRPWKKEGHVEKNAKKIAFWDGSSWKDIEVDKDVGVMGGHHSVLSLRDLDCALRDKVCIARYWKKGVKVKSGTRVMDRSWHFLKVARDRSNLDRLWALSEELTGIQSSI